MMDPAQHEDQQQTPVIRTMRTDAELYAKEKKLSSLQINSAEYVKRSIDTQAIEPYSRPFKKLFVAVVVLLSALILGGGSWFILSRRAVTPAIPAELTAPPSFIASDGQISVLFKENVPQQLLQEIAAEQSKQFRKGALIYLPIKKGLENGNVQYLSASEAIGALGLRPPTLLMEILHRDLGLFIFGDSESSDPVLIIRIVNFEKAFSSMLEWEKTLARDWQLFYPQRDTVSLPRVFTDEIIKNNDSRMLKKDDGSLVVGYTIFNKRYIIISASRDAIRTVLERFMTLSPQ